MSFVLFWYLNWLISLYRHKWKQLGHFSFVFINFISSSSWNFKDTFKLSYQCNSFDRILEHNRNPMLPSNRIWINGFWRGPVTGKYYFLLLILLLQVNRVVWENLLNWIRTKTGFLCQSLLLRTWIGCNIAMKIRVYR